MQQPTKIALAVAIALQSMMSAAVQAQEAPQRVEITGSRIRQVDLETAQPVQVVNQEQIQKSGLVTVGDIVNQLSSVGTPAFSRGSVLTSNREQGGQYINMRNLGAQRLLVLVNGKRWTASVAGFTDMSTVPSALIERIEVLKDGASSIYGSDAIAGVVNIILKKSMDGGTASAYYGENALGDGQNKDFSVSYGATAEKASLLFGLTHTTQGEVWAKDRNRTAFTFGPGHYNSGFGGGPWGRITPVNASGGSNTTASAGGFNRIINHTGSFDGVGTGADSRNPNSYHPYTGADADVFNATQQMHLLSPNKLTSIFTKGEIELPFDMRLTSTAMYAVRDSSRQIAGYPLSSTTQSKYPVYIDKDNYFNPYGNQVAGAGKGIDLFFARRTIEVPRQTDNTNRTLHIDAALEGGFELRSLPWNWSLAYNYNKVEGSNTGYGDLNLLNLKKALGPSFMNASGVVQCGTPTSPIPLAECVPFDIVGGPSASTPAALNYVMAVGQATYGSTISNANADLSGEVFTLPAGAVGVAGGLEYRTVRGYDRPGQFEQSGYSTGLAGNSTFGRFTVREAYLEANIPLLKGVPMAELLNLNLASRYSDYSNFGSTTNSKASFMWKPIKDLLARGTWAEGFRAPTLNDTFGGGSQSYDSYLDPCDSQFGNAATTPATKARCTAAGVPVNFRQVNQAGTPVTAGGAQTPTPFQTGAGNANLQPETAVTKTAGFVYSPSYVPGLSVGLDWFNIRVNNRITGITASYVVNQCYVDGVTSFCDVIKRDPISGQIVNLSRGNANLGAMETEGYDLSLSYRMPRTAYGLFGFRSESTYVDSWRLKSSNTANFTEYAGEFDIFKWKANIAFDWSMGNWSVTLGNRFYSSQKNRCWTVKPAVECSNPEGLATWGTGYNKFKEMWYSDLSVGYALPWNAKLLAGINNIGNKGPIVNYNANSGYGGPNSSSSVNPELPIDRFFYVRYNQNF
ncbi:TonB-dependent receptor domain-containing protein [Massilia sp. MS-15]|uniref:TonB-dependent receptor domain-containing protein n=1 Tax=Massilia sp. MS-15 TaxID=2878200 RepID=UPI001CD55E68|nr:TonB-dependent receptor [Massilia sp. MS-15]MCA1245987.1 TonB-dependent receptor [Massilia sp. MS-15]